MSGTFNVESRETKPKAEGRRSKNVSNSERRTQNQAVQIRFALRHSCGLRSPWSLCSPWWITPSWGRHRWQPGMVHHGEHGDHGEPSAFRSPTEKPEEPEFGFSPNPKSQNPKSKIVYLLATTSVRSSLTPPCACTAPATAFATRREDSSDAACRKAFSSAGIPKSFPSNAPSV